LAGWQIFISPPNLNNAIPVATAICQIKVTSAMNSEQFGKYLTSHKSINTVMSSLSTYLISSYGD